MNEELRFPIVIYDPPVWTVYIHINKVNNKKYVGITSRKPQSRWRNGDGYKPAHGDNNHFYNAIMKYGWNNFDHYILIEKIDSCLAAIYESVFIVLYDSLEPSGYNARTGGQIGAYGYKYSQSYKEKRSGYNSPDSLEVICLTTGERFGSAADAQRKTNAKSVAHACKEGRCSGKLLDGTPMRWMYVKDYNQKTEEEIKAYMEKDIQVNIKKEVICLNTKRIYPSAIQASKDVGLKTSYGIIRSCRGEYAYFGHDSNTGENLQWMYYDEYLNMSTQKIDEIINMHKIPKIAYNPIICINTLETFNYRSYIIDNYDIGLMGSSGIGKSCNGNRFGHIKTSAGRINGIRLYWMNYSDYEKLSTDKKQELKEMYYINDKLPRKEDLHE